MSEKKTCSCCEQMGEGARTTMILGTTIGLAMCLAIVGSIVEKTWLIMIILVPLMVIPIFVVMFNWVKPPDLSNADVRALTMANFGVCFLGFVFSVLVGLPLVLLHTGAISAVYFGFWIAATIVGIAGLAYYIHASAKAEEL